MFASMGLKYLTFTHIRSFLTSSFFLLSIVHMPTFPQESIYADGSITVAVRYLVNVTLQKSVCLSLITPDFFLADHLLCLLFCNKKSMCLSMLLYWSSWIHIIRIMRVLYSWRLLRILLYSSTKWQNEKNGDVDLMFFFVVSSCHSCSFFLLAWLQFADWTSAKICLNLKKNNDPYMISFNAFITARILSVSLVFVSKFTF